MFRKSISFAVLFASAAASASDLSLEPCVNGAVSASGNFPTQEMEEQIHAYLRWRADEPHYLFRVAAERIDTANEDN